MHYLSLCCIAKEEDPFLREWVAYHSLLGVEHFYIYDNGSKTPIRKTLGSYVDGSRVTIRRVEGAQMQLPVYDDCLASFGARNKWIGFLDLDEFALPMRDNDLRVTLSGFEDYGGLAATWHMMGSSGHLSRPRGPVVRNYTEAFAVQESYHIKSFVQPARTGRAVNPHCFTYKPGFFCVNEDYYPVSLGSQATFSAGNLIRVNHYFLRSQQDFEEKLARGRAANASPEAAYDMTMFHQGAARECVTDTVIQRFLPVLENAMAQDVLPPVSPALSPDAPYEEIMETASRLFETGNHEKALAFLCGGVFSCEGKADFWTLRSMIALAMGDATRADVFIRRSMALESTQVGFTQLQNVLRARGMDKEAGQAAALMRRCPEAFA